jgi:hypothetical protein
LDQTALRVGPSRAPCQSTGETATPAASQHSTIATEQGTVNITPSWLKRQSLRNAANWSSQSVQKLELAITLPTNLGVCTVGALFAWEQALEKRDIVWGEGACHQETANVDDERQWQEHEEGHVP